ncbi:MAG TPA: endonuclease/exonuclease/phosphatase family protein [Marmoricola sp.]|nr:endonuclease/exonuclease/phosphatase family protein [Marmoricola sp.]
MPHHRRRAARLAAVVVAAASAVQGLAACGSPTQPSAHPSTPPSAQPSAQPSAPTTPAAGTPAPGGTTSRKPSSPTDGTFVVATFNTLGAWHTSRHGNKPWMASGAVRTHRMVRVLRKHRVDIVGLQEFEGVQARTFRRAAGHLYAFWHPKDDPVNAIAWRRDRFALVGTRTQTLRYFAGGVRRMPLLLLRDRRTGHEFWVMNVHNPADTRRFPGQQRWRAIDMARELRTVHRLQRTTGKPVLVTGDMNEHHSAFCTLTRTRLLHAAAGGSRGRHCRPPSYHQVDWIMGTPEVSFTGFTVDHSRLVRRTTDHDVIVSRARIGTRG